jgi:hypothetical protein
MDDDFRVELSVPQGISVLEPFLSEFPFAVTIGKHDQSEDIVLVQSAVSTVAGFYYEGCKDSVQFYDVSVLRSHSGEPDEVVKTLSRVFKAANLTHRIARVIHELDEDEEIVSYEAPSA